MVPGIVVICPGSVIVVVRVVLTPGRVVVVTLPAAVTVVTTPGKVVVMVCTEVLPGRVVVLAGAVTVVGLGTVEVTVEAGKVIVVSEPNISVVIVEAGFV